MAIARFSADTRVRLDYRDAAQDKDLLVNLSGVASAGDFLWTASDEGRSIECLERHGEGFRLKTQVALDSVFDSIPGAKKAGAKKPNEIDLESIDAFENRLWICGSHCRVRRKPDEDGTINSRLRDRPSRNLLGCMQLRDRKSDVERPGTALPFDGRNSLREILRSSDYIAPFIDLPSKENGLDIEGLCIVKNKLFIGLRGPLIDSNALIIEFPAELNGGVRRLSMTLHFLDLKGLAVRDLARSDDGILIIAGPVSEAPGPFRLYRWHPQHIDKIQSCALICEWPAGRERPEGLCRLRHHNIPGVLIVYDRPDPKRIKGTSYNADWISLSKLDELRHLSKSE